MKITLVDENCTEKSCPISRVFPAIISATNHIYIDVSANSSPIFVEYSYLGYMFCALMDILCEYGVI